MYNIALINLPFADVNVPSIALTQLKHVVECAYADKVTVQILYLNHDFAHYIGEDLYREIATGLQHHTSGLGDWLFRQAAFPNSKDNVAEYFNRYYPKSDSVTRALRERIRSRRAGISRFFAGVIAKYDL